MNSKEALNQLYIMADTPEQAMGINSCYDIVLKDLEVLEILRKHLKTTFTFWSEVITCDIDSLRDEDYEIIEKWLHNENFSLSSSAKEEEWGQYE